MAKSHKIRPNYTPNNIIWPNLLLIRTRQERNLPKVWKLFSFRSGKQINDKKALTDFKDQGGSCFVKETPDAYLEKWILQKTENGGEVSTIPIQQLLAYTEERSKLERDIGPASDNFYL